MLFEGTEQEYQTILESRKGGNNRTKAIIPEVDQAIKPTLYGKYYCGESGARWVRSAPSGIILDYLKRYSARNRAKLVVRPMPGAVVYTRTDDTYVSQFDRPKIADYVNAELLVSIHLNSYEGTEARGIETLFNPLYLENFRLAQTIQSELIASTKAPDRGVRPRTDLAVLNGAKMPAVLVEVGFISHKEEEELLNTKAYQKQIANALADIEYFFLTYR